MTDMPTVIGVTGFARHGKDTVGEYISRNYGYTRLGFADTLKSMAYTLNPIVERNAAPRRLRDVVDQHGWEEAKQLPEVRRVLQSLGTECVRDHLGPDSWVEAMAARHAALGHFPIVITDVRFPNEAEYVKRNGVLLRVYRPRFDNGMDSSHPSEANIPNLPANFELHNSGTLNELYLQVDAVMRDLQEGFHGAVH